jgi:hypothetical protein
MCAAPVAKKPEPDDGAVEITSGGKLQGKLWKARAPDAPLLFVLGGKKIDDVSSGKYMWEFMGEAKELCHVFVARDSSVNGVTAFDAVIDTFLEAGVVPRYLVLYLFSGGYWPGKQLIEKKGPLTFRRIVLVDIWIGLDGAKFYGEYADNRVVMGITTYVNTGWAARNDKVNAALENADAHVPVSGPQTMATHKSANKDAMEWVVSYLKQLAR